MALVYIVEDDENIAELIRASISTIGHEARIMECASLLFDALTHQKPDLILLDIMLPEVSGLEIIKRLKEHVQTNTIPVIFLTAKGNEVDKVMGLELGAEDYITKPFGVLELLARIKTALRRNTTAKQVSKVRDLVINFSSREVTKNGEPIHLTFKEFELLDYLYHNSGIVINRDKLLETVWGFDYEGDSTRTVDMHIRTLRQKLGDNADDPKYIATVRGYGYKFLCE